MRNNIIVQKMEGYASKVLSYCKGYTYETFSADSKLVEACVFNLSQIGELAHKIDADFAEAHPNVPWRRLYGLRNRIVHDYDGVNLTLIWQIVEDDIPALIRELAVCKTE